MEWSLLALPQRAGVLSVDLVDLREPIDLPHAGLWYVTAFAGPRPLGHRWLDAPDTHLSPDFVRLLFSAELMTARRLQLAQGFAERLGVEQREPAAATVTVVVCTRRRREHVERLLDDLVLLDPAPLEILVVDNDPGDEDVEQIALEHRARYLALHEPGLNRARAAAVAHARGEVIAFIDDDCRVPPGWLAAVDRVFADPAVAAATGPAFPVALDTPAQIAFEQAGGFGRGYEPRVVDWRTLPPSSATSLGSGNNMLLRRSSALAIEDLFPPELDAGTATESGGDLYALAALLHAGGKLAFEPELWVRHLHREDGPGLDRVLRGYGTGVVAGLLTLMRTHRDPDTLITGRWLWTQLRDATARRIASRAEPIELAGSVAYVRGALRAPAALRRARRATRGA
jgi:glycosyltransferase involved in cell wall biosynthesis